MIIGNCYVQWRVPIILLVIKILREMCHKLLHCSENINIHMNSKYPNAQIYMLLRVIYILHVITKMLLLCKILYDVKHLRQ